MGENSAGHREAGSSLFMVSGASLECFNCLAAGWVAEVLVLAGIRCSVATGNISTLVLLHMTCASDSMKAGF